MAAGQINASVGMHANGTLKCYNLPADVAVVVQLLNSIDPSRGGAALAASAGPRELYQAIYAFQRTQNDLGTVPRLSVDGHVDPRGATLARMNLQAVRPVPNPTPGPRPVGAQVIPFHEPAPLLISKHAHNVSKADLKSTPTPVSTLPIMGQPLVTRAQLSSTSTLEGHMAKELSLADTIAGVSIGMAAARFFNGNRAALATQTHRVGSEMSVLVSKSAEFAEGHGEVRDAITQAVRAGAARGIIDYHDLAEPRKKVPPPMLGFEGFQALHVYIGSFQGVNVLLNDFEADTAAATYSADLTYEFFDHFGAGDDDTVFDGRGHGTEGQAALWILQRERRPSHMPFIVKVVVNRSIVKQPF